MLQVDVLSMSYHYKDYWTIWVGRLALCNSPSDSDASLLKIGVHGGWRFDILWSSFFISRARRWWFNRKRKQKLSRAVRVEADCLCGHDIYSHTAPQVYVMAPCGMCECEEYMPAEHPYCECGHHPDDHAKLGPNLFLGCLDEECGCDIYTPETALQQSVARLCQEFMEEYTE